MPLWGFFLVPIAGTIFSSLGEFALQAGYATVMLMFAGYFVEDLLKCKIRIQDDVIHFGFRTFNLNDLAAVNLQYKKNQVLPKSMLLNFHSGKKLKLKISRLNSEDADTLTKYIETRHPKVTVDPVLRTLAKCKKLARRSYIDSEYAVEIPYSAHRMFRQLYETFLGTAEKWMRVGPLLALALTTPMWLNMFSGLFTAMSGSQYEKMQKLLVKRGFEGLYNHAGKLIAEQNDHLWTRLTELVSSPLIATLLTAVVFALVYYLVRLLLKPNALMLRPDGMSLELRMFGHPFTLSQTPYDKIADAKLEKKRNGFTEDWKINFSDAFGKQTASVSLNAIEKEDRERFLTALSRFAPNCEIDSALAETMLPKQDRSYTELWLQSLAAPTERQSVQPLEPLRCLQSERYEVQSNLGVGGQGTAYLAIDTATAGDDYVVLKETILPLFVEAPVRQQALERFENEAIMLDKINHDGIVKLLNYFVEDHRGYLVLEHVDGKSLRHYVQEIGAFDEATVLDFATQMCDMLSCLEERGIVHRDFTPDNLILRGDGRLTLIDFNVAQSAESGSTGTIVGKHAFLPPEQFRGKPTHQSDIYAMGATLFYLITGKDPEPITCLQAAEHCTTAGPELHQLISECTELSLAKRVKTAADARARLTTESFVIQTANLDERVDLVMVENADG